MAMTELKPCPFGADHKVWIAVHDDEGNYHGPIGCEYESDPWSGLKYALHHEDVDNGLLGTDGDYEAMSGVLFETPAEAEETWNARWERTCHDDGIGEFRCDECGAFVKRGAVMDCCTTIPIRHCPNCGAKVVEQ